MSTNTNALYVQTIIERLKNAIVGLPQPAATLIIEKYGRNPFIVLISCVLSLRTKDAVSYAASCRLFEQAATPQTLIMLPNQTIEQLIYPTGFYRRKTAQIKAICTVLIEKHNSQVPSNAQELMMLPGVGLKTTNLVLSEAFIIPALIVDTHVHRVSNRLGLVNTKTPEQTEAALKKVIPQDQWILFNTLIVTWGQNICGPISPKCSLCPLNNICPKKGVTYKR